jgi:hypothetical protein
MAEKKEEREEKSCERGNEALGIFFGKGRCEGRYVRGRNVLGRRTPQAQTFHLLINDTTNSSE